MQRFLLPVLATLGLLFLAIVGFLFLRTPADDGDRASAQPTTVQTPEEPDSDGPDQVAEPDAVAESAPRAQAADVAPAIRADDWDPADAVDVSVTVVLPEGTPGDDQTEILVFRDALDVHALERQLRQLAAERRGERERSSQLKAVEPLPPSGKLVIPMPKSSGQAYVAARGRYTYSVGTTAVALDAEAPSIALEPELGIWVSGKLVPPAGADEELSQLEGLEVELRANVMSALGGGSFQIGSRPDFNVGMETALDADNAFEFWGVPDVVDYRASGVPERLAAFKTEYIDARPGEHVELEVTLAYGGQLVGRVVDQHGTPVPEAKLEVEQDPMMFGQGGIEVREGESDEEGYFHLVGVAAGESILRAEKDGYLETTTRVEVVDGETLHDLAVELSSGNFIAGRVVWPDQTPVVGADIDVDFDASELAGLGGLNAMRGADGDAETDEDGRFRVTGLGAGPFSVTAEAPPRGAPDAPGASDEEDLEELDDSSNDDERWTALADGVAPGTEDLLLELSAPIGISGVVVDDLGEPVQEFKVTAVSQRGGMLAGLVGDRASKAFDNEDGEFELLGLSPGDWGVRASGAAHGRSEETILTLPGDGAELVITLPRAATVRGRVLDPVGNTVAGAKIAPVMGFADMGQMRGEDNKIEAVSTEDGSFELTGVPSGSFTIEASAEGFAPSEETTVEAEPAELLEEVVLTLREGGVLTGEVFTPEGELDIGRSILAQVPTQMLNQRWATTDSEGSFRFEHMKPGTWQVMTFGAGGGLPGGGDNTDPADDLTNMLSDMKFTMAEVRDGEETHVVLGAPPENPVTVTGQVTLDSEPVPGVFVTFVADQSDGGASGMEAMRFKTTDSEGRYEVELDGAGAYLVNVQQVQSAGTQQTITYNTIVPENKDEHRADFDPPVGAISGSVFDPDGKPAANARVSLSKEGAIPNGMLVGERFTEAVTNGAGEYEMVWLNPGTYTVSAGGSLMGGLFGTETTQARQVRSGVEVGDGQHVEGVDFHLERPGTVDGKVVDETGKPVANASVFVRDESGNVLERMSAAMSDAGGNFEYGGLAPGRYTVEARGSGRVSHEGVPVSVREGETSSVDVVLHQGTMLVVSLVRKDELPVQASISVLDSYGRQVNGVVSFGELMEAFNNGSFSTKEQRIGPLPPGSYKVEAVSGGKTYKKPVTLTGQAERRLKVRIKD